MPPSLLSIGTMRSTIGPRDIAHKACTPWAPRLLASHAKPRLQTRTGTRSQTAREACTSKREVRHGVQGPGRPAADLDPPRPHDPDQREGWSDQLAERQGALLL